jgi:hypothetical protein
MTAQVRLQSMAKNGVKNNHSAEEAKGVSGVDTPLLQGLSDFNMPD